MGTVSPIYLKKLRLSTGLTQKQFAESVGLPRSTYRDYENGRRGITFEKYRQVKEKLGYLYDGTGQNLQVMLDYVRITFKDVRDLDSFVKDYLYCPLSEFVDATTGLMTYNRVWRRGNIWCFDYADKLERDNYQVTIQLSGQGCREMELVMTEQGLSWYDFFAKMANRSDMQVTRLDIALDELYRGPGHEQDHIQLSDLISKVYRDELVTKRIRTWNHIGGGQLRNAADDENAGGGQGISIYFGSRQSNLYFNFYEKRYEIAQREGIEVEEALEVFGLWNRYELRLSQGKAQSTVEEFLAGVDFGELVRAILTEEIAVYDGINQYGAYVPDQKWQRLFGGIEPLKLTVKPEPYNIERTIRWLMKQVADTYAMVGEADKVMNTEYLEMFRSSGKINERGEEILRHLRTSFRPVSPNKVEEVDEVTVEQFIFDHYSNLNALVEQVVGLLPDKVFYQSKLGLKHVRKMKEDLEVLNVRRHQPKFQEDQEVQDAYFQKLTIYNRCLEGLAKEGRKVQLKKLLGYKQDRKAKVLMDLIAEYGLLEELKKAG